MTIIRPLMTIIRPPMTIDIANIHFLILSINGCRLVEWILDGSSLSIPTSQSSLISPIIILLGIYIFRP